MRKKHGMTKKQQPIEMGTTNSKDVDMDWIPKEVLNHASKSKKGYLHVICMSLSYRNPLDVCMSVSYYTICSDKSPRPGSPQNKSPRQRKNKRAVGADD